MDDLFISCPCCQKITQVVAIEYNRPEKEFMIYLADHTCGRRNNKLNRVRLMEVPEIFLNCPQCNERIIIGRSFLFEPVFMGDEVREIKFTFKCTSKVCRYDQYRDRGFPVRSFVNFWEGDEEMKNNDHVLNYFRRHLGYNDELMKIFREDPESVDLISRISALMEMKCFAEVVDSNMCSSRHKIGDKFYFDGTGSLITDLCPDRVCIFALSTLSKLIFSSNELFFAAYDPSKMRYRRFGCSDLSDHCGGRGNIVMEIHVEDRPGG